MTTEAMNSEKKELLTNEDHRKLWMRRQRMVTERKGRENGR